MRCTVAMSKQHIVEPAVLTQGLSLSLTRYFFGLGSPMHCNLCSKSHLSIIKAKAVPLNAMEALGGEEL
jgi:hypothetical protein